MTNPVRVTVTGAAGQIGYSIVFRIASGQLLGPDQPVDLRLLEIPPAMGALEGVAMEIIDCAFPLVSGLDLHDDPGQALDGVNIALLVGSRPRTKGMERAELLAENGKIFTGQGSALNDHAASDVKVLVVGNPANTNCLIAMNNAPDIPRERFTAMMRLDHNRAIAQLAAKLGVAVSDVSHMGVWGNHSPTMYPDLFHAQVRGEQAAGKVDDQAWIEERVPAQRRQARRRDHRGARRVLGRVGRERRDRPRARLGGWHRRSLGLDGSSLRRLLRDRGGAHLRRPVHLRGGEVVCRAGTGDQRVLARADRRFGRGADRRARHGQRSEPDLRARRPAAPSIRSMSGRDQGIAA